MDHLRDRQQDKTAFPTVSLQQIHTLLQEQGVGELPLDYLLAAILFTLENATIWDFVYRAEHRRQGERRGRGAWLSAFAETFATWAASTTNGPQPSQEQAADLLLALATSFALDRFPPVLTNDFASPPAINKFDSTSCSPPICVIGDQIECASIQCNRRALGLSSPSYQIPWDKAIFNNSVRSARAFAAVCPHCNTIYHADRVSLVQPMTDSWSHGYLLVAGSPLVEAYGQMKFLPRPWRTHTDCSIQRGRTSLPFSIRATDRLLANHLVH